MTVNDIVSLAMLDCGESSPTISSYAVSQIKFHYEILYNAHNWKEAMMDPPMEFDLPAPILIPQWPGTSLSLSFYQTQALPLQYDKVIWAKGSVDAGNTFPFELKPRDRGWIEHNDPYSLIASPLTLPTPQQRYYYLGRPRGFPTLSPGLITFTPTINSSASFQLTIDGTDVNFNEQTETFTLSGVTPITTANSYLEVHNISKSTVPTVPVTVAPAVGSSVTFGANDENLRYTTAVFWPPFNGAFRVRVGAKLKMDPLPTLQSIPRISGLFQALYYFARSAIRSKQRQMDAALADRQLGSEMFLQAKNDELSQMGNFMQIQPKNFDDPAEVWDRGWTGS